MIIQICVGSSCHIKGSQEIVELLQTAITANQLENQITLCGSFCTGSCNRVGVTVQVNEEICTGITAGNFHEFFQNKVLTALSKERT